MCVCVCVYTHRFFLNQNSVKGLTIATVVIWPPLANRVIHF